MANIVILGVYATKTALDTAEKASASAGDTYLVGSKCPYDLYKFTSGEFKKGDAVGTKSTLDISISDVNQDIPIASLYNITFKGEDGKSLKVRKGLHLGEIHLFVPEE